MFFSKTYRYHPISFNNEGNKRRIRILFPTIAPLLLHLYTVNIVTIHEQFAQTEEWTSLCDALASRLRAVGNTLAATLCYICAGNIDKTVEIWSRSLTTEHEGKSYVDLLQVSILQLLRFNVYSKCTF